MAGAVSVILGEVGSVSGPKRARWSPTTGGSEDFREAWDDFKDSKSDRRPDWTPVKKAANITPNQYAAGLMNSIHDLTWYVDLDIPLKPKPKPIKGYRAPSWSWASIDSKITLWASDK